MESGPSASERLHHRAKERDRPRPRGVFARGLGSCWIVQRRLRAVMPTPIVAEIGPRMLIVRTEALDAVADGIVRRRGIGLGRAQVGSVSGRRVATTVAGGSDVGPVIAVIEGPIAVAQAGPGKT